MTYEDYVNSTMNGYAPVSGYSPAMLNAMVDNPGMPAANVQPISTQGVPDSYTPYDQAAIAAQYSQPLFDDALNSVLNSTSSLSDAKPSNNTYKIKRGDSLSKIAKMYGTSVESLALLNNIQDISSINTGDKLILPEGAKLKSRYIPIKTTKVTTSKNNNNGNAVGTTAKLSYSGNLDKVIVQEQNKELAKNLGSDYKNVRKIDVSRDNKGTYHYVYTMKNGDTLKQSYIPKDTVRANLPEVTIIGKGKENKNTNAVHSNSNYTYSASNKPTREQLLESLNSGKISFVDNYGNQVTATRSQVEKFKNWLSGPMTGNPPAAIRGLVVNLARIAGAQGRNWLDSFRKWFGPAVERMVKGHNNPTSRNGRFVAAPKNGAKRPASHAKAVTRNVLLNP